MVKCSDCVGYYREQPEICVACKKMRAESDWQMEIDTGNRMLRCPDCEHGYPLHIWQYSNPYRYCPWCGKQRVHGEQIKMEI